MIASIHALDGLRRREVLDLRSQRRLIAGLLIVVGWLWSTVVTAEMVVFTHGGYLKIASFEIQDQNVHLELLRGGSMQVPLLTIERILEDEVSTRKDPVEPPPTPIFNLRFDEAQPSPQAPFAELIYETAKRYQLNPALVAAVARAESNFDPRAVSHKGACGLMQLMPATAQRFGIEGDAVFEPSRNLDAGSRYLSWLTDRFDGNLSHVLAAYNSGEGTVDRYGGIPPYKETQRYVRRIYAHLGLPDPESEPSPSG